MTGWTNKGKAEALDARYRGTTIPTNYYLALLTSATAPGPDTNTMTDVTQINTGNGYSDGGYQITPGATDFDVLTEDDTNDRGLIQLKDIVWSASGGSIPSGGSGARYGALTDDNATVANREIYHHWDLTSDRSVSDGQDLTLQDCEIRIDES